MEFTTFVCVVMRNEGRVLLTEQMARQRSCTVWRAVMFCVMYTNLINYFDVFVAHFLVSGASGNPDPPFLRRCGDAAGHDDAIQQMRRVPIGQVVRVTQGPGVALRGAMKSGREDLGLEAIKFCPIH